MAERISLLRGSALESFPVPLTSTVHPGEGGICAAPGLFLPQQVPALKPFLGVWTNVKVNKKRKSKRDIRSLHDSLTNSIMQSLWLLQTHAGYVPP